MKLITAGKKTPSVFFEKSGIRTKKNFDHHPMLAFVRKDGNLVVRLVTTPQELVGLPLKTRVMAQWVGKTRSDYFTFSVGKLKEYIANNPKKPEQVI